MDEIYLYAEDHLLKPYVFPENFTLEEGTVTRQFVGLSFLSIVGGYILYFLGAGLSYYYIFDQRLTKHPLFLEDQVWKEIKVSMWSLPCMSMLTVPFFLLEMQGYSKLYPSSEGTWGQMALSIICFVFFTDCFSYWIHRFLHTKFAYKRLHKLHHVPKIPTPWASHAFHPLDGFLQSIPFHSYVFLFPMDKYVYLSMFVMVNFYAVFLHDGDYRLHPFLKIFLNGAAHHTDHHLYYNYNFGQYFTLWDRLAGTIRHPSAFEKDSTIDNILKGQCNGSVANGKKTK